MTKMRFVVKPLIYILLSVFILLAAGAVNKKDSWMYLNLYLVVGIHIAVYFAFGISLSLIDKKLRFHFSLFHLIVCILCLLGIVLMYALYAVLPYFILTNMNMIEMLLAGYAGANCFTAFFKGSKESKEKVICPTEESNS